VQSKVEPSVVYLQFWTGGGKEGAELGRYGTGFVFEAPDKTRWIMTSAHSLAAVVPKDPKDEPRKIRSVRYRQANQDRFADCGKALIDESYDLAVFQPHKQYPLKVPALELHAGDLRPQEPLYAVGSASALPAAPYAGHHSSDPITVADIARHQRLRVEAFKPFVGDLTFLRHDIPIAPGYSGCPIVTEKGQVAGVQSSTLPDASFVSFAVHAKHIRKFDWERKPVDLVAVDLSKSAASQVLALTAAGPAPFAADVVPDGKKGEDPPPIKVKLGGVAVEAPFVHHGYIERDARTVIEKYVQDKEWYLQEQYGGMRVLRLQELLDRMPVARISNPVLGFQMLVPKGYRYSAQATTKPDGILVTFSPPAERKVAKPYDRPVSVWVTVEPELYERAREEFEKKIKAGEIKPTAEEKANPARFATYRERYVNATVADVVDPRFALRNLDIRIQDGEDKYRGNPKAEAFKPYVAGEGAWLRCNYQSLTSSLCHNVRVGNRDPLVLVVHYQYTKEDAKAFLDLKGNPDPTDLEFTLLAASVSSK
jgi:S1-C subfamily serine protease